MFVDWILVIDRYLYIARLVIAVNIDVAPAGTKTGHWSESLTSQVSGHRSQVTNKKKSHVSLCTYC